MKINPKFFYNEKGEKEQVLLSYEDFTTLIEKIEDLEDLIALREARELNKDQPFYTIEEVMKEFGIVPEEESNKHRKAQ